VTVYDCSSADTRAEGLAEAGRALSRGGLVVMPTDTVYGIAANAFDPGAVAALLAAKQRHRSQPPPVLVPTAQTLAALTVNVPGVVDRLIAELWPGPLTVICHAQPTLAWDLGDTHGTVALRMPDHQLALELLSTTGPLAVSSANISHQPAATTVLEAATAFGAAVAVYLDDGPSPGGVASTIVDATGPRPRIVREGAVSRETLAAIAPEFTEDEEPPEKGVAAE